MHTPTIVRALTACAAGAIIVGGAGPATAGSPHFIKNATGSELTGFSLRVDFKEAGLESGSVETVVAAAHLDATYQCINGGNINPNDSKKTVVSGDVSESGQFTAGRNGNLVGSLVIDPPAAETVLDCPNGQDAALTAVTYSAVSVSDLTSGAFLALPGSFSAGAPVD